MDLDGPGEPVEYRQTLAGRIISRAAELMELNVEELRGLIKGRVYSHLKRYRKGELVELILSAEFEPVSDD